MRVLKSSDEFFDILDNIKNGCFVTIGYVTSANVEVPIVKRKNPLTNRMKGYNDYSQFNREDSNDNIGALVKITSYNFNYRNRQSVHDEYYERVRPETNKIRAEFGLDDVNTKENNYKNVMNYGANGQEVYGGTNEKLFGNSYSPQNMAKALHIKSKIYAVNSDGHIIRELDSNEVKFKAKKDPSGVAALRKMGVDEDRIKEYISKLNSLNFAYKNFEANSILYMVATINGEKIVYINSNLNRTVEDIDINPQDFIQIAKEKYKQDINEIKHIMKRNVIRLTENDLHEIIKESVNRILKESGHLYGKYDDGTPFTNSKAKWHGVEGTTFISHGEWSDPTVWYAGEELNGNELEDFVWNEYKYECEESENIPSEEEFDNLPTEWFKEKLDDYMEAIFVD